MKWYGEDKIDCDLVKCKCVICPLCPDRLFSTALSLRHKNTSLCLVFLFTFVYSKTITQLRCSVYEMYVIQGAITLPRRHFWTALMWDTFARRATRTSRYSWLLYWQQRVQHRVKSAHILTCFAMRWRCSNSDMYCVVAMKVHDCRLRRAFSSLDK